jgi:hypothetical protein
MKAACIGIALLLSLATPSARAAESGPPQRQLKAYPLHGNPNSAEISPDETRVATEITRLGSSNDPSNNKAVELAQLWDFREDRLVAEVPLQVATDQAHLRRGPSDVRFTRFTGDGKLVVFYLDHVLHVLSGKDLSELSQIRIDGPPGLNRSFKAKSGVQSWVEKPRVEILEVSPAEHRIAAAWIRGLDFARVEVYDLDSGKQLGGWNTRERGLGVLRPKALQWDTDGQRLVVAVPNTFPCLSPDNQPDLFVVDALSGSVRMKLTTGLLVGDISVTPDERVWAVDYDCLGVFKNHAPKMKVFDLRTGKRLKELSGRGSGVRYAVSASRNGNRVAAYTGKMRVHFDWGDMVPSDVFIDRTFSLWNLNNYEGIVTSQDLTLPLKQHVNGRRSLVLRLSERGGFVLFEDTIYEIPADK